MNLIRMRIFHFLAVALIFAPCVSFAQAQTPAASPVVIELFTSEGCSSCPPADRLLARLQAQGSLAGANLILLGEHVDYWNSAAWTDRFSQKSFSERQTEYDRAAGSQVYTPQLIVDGHPADPNTEADLERVISNAAKTPKPAHVSMSWAGPNQLQIGVEEAPKARVLFFVTEDDLTTAVKGGENGGVTLHHAAVVREMRDLGKTANGSFQDSLNVDWNPQWQRKDLHFVVIVQRGAGPILGAAALLPHEQPDATKPSAGSQQTSLQPGNFR